MACTFKRVDADALDSLIDKDEQVESVLNEKSWAYWRSIFGHNNKREL